jgi:hypothetical protein
MATSDYIVRKWDARLYNWSLWIAGGAGGTARAGGSGVSSIYSGVQFSGGYRDVSDVSTALSGEAMDTDALLLIIQRDDATVFSALVEWTANRGTRGEQAARQSCHANTLKNRVMAGYEWLERLARDRRRVR